MYALTVWSVPPRGSRGTSTAMPLWPTRLRISLAASTASACVGTASSSQRSALVPTHRVFDASEEIGILGVLRRRSLDVAQLLVQPALLLRERPGHNDVEIHELVAAARAPQMRHTLPADADHLAVLRRRGDAHLHLAALDRGHADLVAEYGLRRRDAQHVDEVVIVALERLVVLDADEHIEIAGGATAHAGLAVAGDAKLLAVVDARRDGQRDLAILALAPFAAAARADLVDSLAGAAAPRTGGDVDKPAEDRLLHLPD